VETALQTPHVLMKPLPDKRAEALVDADYVQHVKIRRAAEGAACALFATVGASYRDTTHLVALSWPLSEGMCGGEAAGS
jgi:hypothetical protein